MATVTATTNVTALPIAKSVRRPAVTRADRAQSRALRRRLAVRYERRDDIHLAFTVLGCACVCLNQIKRFC